MIHESITYDQPPKWQEEMLSDYMAAKKRVFLLDYDGTLAPFVDKPELAEPSARVKESLGQLVAQKQTEVVIISGRDKSDLSKWFKDIPVTLIVGHGSFIRHAGHQQWQEIGSHDTSWQPAIFDILEECASKVPGSFVEHKTTSLVWHYRVADSSQVQEHLPQLKQSLQMTVNKLGLKIEDGSMILEVMPKGIDKGTAAMEYSKDADFVVAIGDDTTDEAMFKVLPPVAWTIKVGTSDTAARHRVQDVEAVHNLLDQFNKVY